MYSELIRHWKIDRQIVYLNHGAFGNCPKSVLSYQRKMQDRMEQNAMKFLVWDLEPLLDQARTALADFVGANGSDLIFVPNATAGVNTVLRSIVWKPGDELLTTNHAYNACANALRYVAEQCGAKVIIAPIPFPFETESQLIDPILESVTPRTRLVLLDHITSPTAVIFPIQKIVQALDKLGIDTLVDGAHAPGMVPLNLKNIGAAYYTGNCHKWLCAPKGSAFLHVRQDRQQPIRPLVISHGANSIRGDRSRFLIEFAWTGTGDFSSWLAVPKAIDYMNHLVSGGWPAIMEQNHLLALKVRRLLSEMWGITPPCPETFLGSMATLLLPPEKNKLNLESPLFIHPWQDALRQKHGFEVPIAPWPSKTHWSLRVSAQLYNTLEQFEALGRIVAPWLK